MDSYHPATTRGDGKLWAFALGLSVGLNLALLTGFGVLSLTTIELRKKTPVVSKTEALSGEESSVQIYPEMFKKFAPESATKATFTPPPAVVQPPAQEFARTSDDQRGKRPDKPAFMGERDTQATSDRAPDPTAPPMPSQAGIQPKDARDFETTQSHFRDGALPDRNIPSPEPSQNESETGPEAAASEASPPPKPAASVTAPPPAPPMREKLLTGPNPVEVPVPEKTQENPENSNDSPKNPETAIKPSEEKESSKDPAKEASKASKPKPKQAINDPAFAGYQRKTAIRGSISRTGRSSLDVEDSPLGRYQAAISRAVELEWQRNCVRHRDFITPGFLTLRFTVEPSGKVRSVKFLDGMQTGEVQKGFTLNSIRNAPIPPMPESIRKDYAKEPLELIFNFYF